MKNKLIGIVGILMGGTGIYRWLTADPALAASQPASYNSGYAAGTLVTGAVGLYYFFKSPS